MARSVSKNVAVEKIELNPVAFGYTIALSASLSYLFVMILMIQFGYGSWVIVVFKSLIISNSYQMWIIWIIPELIQLVIIGFTGGYIFATLYNRISQF
jgi:hypothetical protein